MKTFTTAAEARAQAPEHTCAGSAGRPHTCEVAVGFAPDPCTREFKSVRCNERVWW